MMPAIESDITSYVPSRILFRIVTNSLKMMHNFNYVRINSYFHNENSLILPVSILSYRLLSFMFAKGSIEDVLLRFKVYGFWLPFTIVKSVYRHQLMKILLLIMQN